MALVNCPECGREKVSDSAEMCPDCGYSIKMHFEKIKFEEEEKIRKQREEEERKENARRAEGEKRKAELEAKRQAENRVKSVPKPAKPQFSKGMRNYLIIASVWWLFFITCISNVDWSIRLSNGGMLVFITEIIPLLIYIFASYIPQWSRYNYAQENFEAYQRQVVKEQDEALARMKANAEARRIREMNSPKCPMCNSINIEKISTTSRAVSIATVGLASGKIGKQYKCKNCKHMW